MRRLMRMLFSRTSSWFWGLQRYVVDFRREVGDPMESSTVAATVQWFAKNFPEATPALWRRLDNGQRQQEWDHALLELLQRPNPHYTGPLLWMATATDWLVNGNAYWIVIPSRAGIPVELWWAPSWMIEPKGSDTDGGVFVDHYEYRVDGAPHKLAPEQVIHFRNGLDPNNPRLGCSPLKSVLREVFTDNEAADFTAALLRNMGVPGLLVSPEANVTIEDDEAQRTKAELVAKTTGARRGEPLVMTGATKIQQFGFSPEQLLLRELRRVPEERVTAALGIPAVVVGLGAGLDRSTFTNMAEAREAAYESGLIPAQRILGEDVRFQLLPLFRENPFEWRFGFDLAEVRVLQEDLYRQAQRLDLGFRGAWVKRSEVRRQMNLEVDEDADDVYMVPLNVQLVPAGGGAPTILAPSRNGNGAAASNGHGQPEVSAAAIADEVERRLERRELLAAP